MTEKARKAVAKAERKKKRKADGNGKRTKSIKSKTEGNQTIFIQPPNLAEGCILKDYQLEGVRWLASLFENGVSGILADGKAKHWLRVIVALMILSYRNGSW